MLTKEPNQSESRDSSAQPLIGLFSTGLKYYFNNVELAISNISNNLDSATNLNQSQAGSLHPVEGYDPQQLLQGYGDVLCLEVSFRSSYTGDTPWEV